MRCKALSEMTIEELRKLFPISLHKHNPLWKDWFCEEKKRIISFIGGGYRISHIGSTAIADIMAKNIVDILVEAHDPAAMEKAAHSAGATLSAMTLAQMETLWEQAKRTEREGTQK